MLHPVDRDYDPSVEVDGIEYLRKLDDFIEYGVGGTGLLEGIEAPPLEALDDALIPRVLTDLVWHLYDQGVLIEYTDHLSGRELYAELLKFCVEPHLTFPNDPYSNLRWSPIGGCSEEDTGSYLRYYARQEDREYWVKKFPEDEMPPSELPPYPRPWIPDEVPRTPRIETIEP
ncbi:hypothetical protein EON82_11830 [bacterium]|nr:MAG: hypothetical protein EON82_11830 [bacterium]